MLLTKLHIPTPSQDTIHRKQLSKLLDEAQNKKLVLVSAPAGYGKTTLISDWIFQNKVDAVWCSIDKRDNDPIEFLKLMVTAVNRKFDNIGKSSLELLETPGTAKFEYIIELFINDLLKLENETVLVLDDLHLVTNKPVFDILSALIDYKPANLPLIISTRSDPPISFSRLRSQNELLELRARDLSFSKTDISFLFNKRLKLELSESDLNILEQKTEGWIAGLQLTAITVEVHSDVSAYLKKMAGDNRYIMDYLMEEVLNNQSEEINQFLVRTSLFEKLSGSLCDAVLSKNNSQQILDSLEKSNMFLISLDDERKWFRYHHLFADLLKQRLIAKAKSEITDLHKKASKWFESNEFLINAIEHAIEGGDKERALLISNKIANNLWETSQYGILSKLGSYFTSHEILSNISFCVAYTWVLTVTGKVELAEDYLKTILKGTNEKRLLGRIYGTLNFIAVFKGDTEDAFRYSELATKNIAEDDILWGTWAYISYGEAHLLRFELVESVQSFRKAREKIDKHNNVHLNLITESKSAYVLKLQGRSRDAYTVFKKLLEAHLQIGISSFNITSSIIYSMIGLLEVEQNNLEEGIEFALKGYELSQHATSISFKGYCIILLAEAYYKVGKLNESIKKIEELEEALVNKSAQWISVLAIALKSKLYVFKGELEKAEKLLPQKIRTEKDYTFERYFFNISKARLFVARQKYQESIDLLEQLSKDLQADNAIELLTEVELVKAKAHLLWNKRKEAQHCVISAVQKTQSEISIRCFICEGEQIEEIVKQISKEKKTKSSKLLDSVSQDFLDKLIHAFEKEKKDNKSSGTKVLTSREIDTIQLIAQDLTNQEIADKLFVSLNTIKTHLKNIYLKLEVDNRRKAVEKAKSEGLL